MIACNNAWHLVETKSMKKVFGTKFGKNGPKSDQKLGFLPFSQV